MGLTAIAAVLFLVLFILMCINDRYYSKIYCNYYFTLGAISEGSKNNLKYMGLDNIQKLLQNFQLDIPQMEKI